MDAYISSPEVARRLGLKPQTLRKWRALGQGPAYVRLGGSTQGRVMYSTQIIERWLAERTARNTAEESQRRACAAPDGSRSSAEGA